MKKIIIIILISFTQIQLKAESIKDLEIEGISIGDSLLNFYSKSEILNFSKDTYDKGVFNVLGTNERINHILAVWAPLLVLCFLTTFMTFRINEK